MRGTMLSQHGVGNRHRMSNISGGAGGGSHRMSNIAGAMNRHRMSNMSGATNAPPVPDQQRYLFPKFSPVELIQDMSELGYPITKEMLKAPTHEDVVGVMDFFLTKFYGDERKTLFLSEPKPEADENAPYQDHGNSQCDTFFLFFRACQRMLAEIHYPNFGIRDLFTPSRHNFIWQLSALLNYAVFVEHRNGNLDYDASEDDIARETQELQAQLEQCEIEIADINKQREEEAPHVEKKKQRVADLTLELASLHKEQVALADTTRELKASVAETNEEIAATKLKLMREKQEIEKLSVQVVSSPDRVKAEISEMAQQLEHERESAKSILCRTNDLRLRSESLGHVLSEVSALVKLVDECSAMLEKEKACQKKVHSMRAKNEELKDDAQSRRSKINLMKMEIDNIAQRLTRGIERRKQLMEQIGRLDSELDDKEKENERIQNTSQLKIDKNTKNEEEITQDMIDMSKNFDKELARLQARKQAVLKKAIEYNTGLLEDMKVFSEGNRQSVDNAREEADQIARECAL